jgi:hypothetical protein
MTTGTVINLVWLPALMKVLGADAPDEPTSEANGPRESAATNDA